MIAPSQRGVNRYMYDIENPLVAYLHYCLKQTLKKLLALQTEFL